MVASLRSLRRAARYTVPGLMMVLFVYGAARFHDGPIGPCDAGYCSTHGVVHTADDFVAYKTWERAIWVIWPLGMVALFFLQRSKGDE